MSAETETAGVDRRVVKDLFAKLHELEEENKDLRGRVEKLEDEVGIGGERFR